MQLQNHWKESSNLILLTPSTSPTIDSLCDYDVLTIRSKAKSVLNYNSLIFPGGPLHSSDFSAKWWQILEKFSINSNRIKSLTSYVSNRPPIISDNITLEDLRRCSSDEENFVPTDIALRIAAIRHVFQQTGILLVEPMSTMNISSDQMNKWRQTVIESPNKFVDLCDVFDLKPDLWSLHEWWNWLTPTSVGRSPRFDTIYYICVVNNPVLHESQHWCSPHNLLNGRLLNGYFLSPPQIYELSRLLNFVTIDEVNEFAVKRGKEGIERWIPNLAMYSDGAISSLPGDDYYPDCVELFASKPVRSYPQSLKEIRLKSVNLNRLELRGTLCEVIANIDMPFKHIRPLSKLPEHHIISAKL